MSIKARALVLGLSAALSLAACAGRAAAPPAMPAVARYPDFMYPAVPMSLQRAPGAERIDSGWRFLQNGDTRSAARDFAAALARNPQLYPARAGDGYVALARADYDRALAAFDAALKSAPDYVPALVGRGQTLLAMKRDVEALAAFEAALAADSSLTDVRRRVDVLRFRTVEQVIESARSDAADGRLDRARTAYERAIELSPESSFLYRELAAVERRQGEGDRALQHFERAVELDPSDTAALIAVGDLRAERQDYPAAEEAYRNAAAIDPTPEVSAKIAALADRVRELKFPPEFQAIPESSAVTRGELAALIGVRLERFLAGAPQQQVVITDAAGHWAGPWIAGVARAAVMDPFENHTFQPELVIRRGDLATAVRRLLTLAVPNDPALRKRLAEQPKIADMPTTHLVYPAAAAAVASGVMPLVDGMRFEVNRPVTGAEAVEVINRLQTLVR
jgi:tetratricopeptide (TPR) repeat protein